MKSARKEILTVDGDAESRRTLRDQLKPYEEYHLCEAETGAEALQVARVKRINLILLEVGLPDLDGRDLCRVMRRRGIRTPIIMLTSYASDSDIILGLDAGANDYITKPLCFSVLIARIRAHLRGQDWAEDDAFEIGPYHFIPWTRQLIDTQTNRKVRLTDMETELLKFLSIVGENVVVSRATLLDEVWRYSNGVASSTVQTTIYRLRQKIEPDPSNPTILRTVTGGYCLGPNKIEPFRAT